MKGLLLISDGIDSPVAGYLMLKQGMQMGTVHFSNQPFVDENPGKKAAQLTKKLAKTFRVRIPFFTVSHGKAQEQILTHCDAKLRCVICKRFMYRVAERLAREKGFDCLVTGENIGQVASQTLENQSVIDAAVRIPVFRPLLCNDKTETIDIAKRISTYQISVMDSGKCSLVPKNPATKTTEKCIVTEEKKLGIPSLVDELVSSATMVECG